MIGLHADILIRYLAQDDPDQSERAGQVIEGLSKNRPGYVTMLVLTEIHRVLRRRYGLDAETVTEIVLGLLASAEIVVERADTVRQALRRCADGADFEDALVEQLGREAGCDLTVTLDPAAAAITGMRLAV
ncbi:PIN domain-containing protein [Nocardia amikacinitolerans]|uniref:PIN domain-containing protein n=1 Tax=Nocardia amikacinitolerans TaxID=756689 RepID=UPI00369F16F6